jgi:hypothetical protein
MPSFAPPTAVAQPPKRTSDDLPLPLLVVAGLLVLVAASAVISLGRR